MRNRVVMENYEWAIDCLKKHGLDVDEHHGELCIFLCELVDSGVDTSKAYIHSRIHLKVHKMVMKQMKQEESEILTGLLMHYSKADEGLVDLKVDLENALNSRRRYPLTEKDFEVCRLLAGGCSQKDIAEMFGVCTSSVAVRVHRIAHLLCHSSTKFYNSWL